MKIRVEFILLSIVNVVFQVFIPLTSIGNIKLGEWGEQIRFVT